MRLLGFYMGNVTRVRKKMIGSAVFLKLVRPIIFCDPACAENRVPMGSNSLLFKIIIIIGE